MSCVHHRPRLRLLIPAVLAGAVVGVVIAAWVISPAAGGLALRVEARVQRAGGRLVGLGEIAPVLGSAVVATEDERFYRHHGIDLIGVARALPYDLVHFSFAQGASTITEQVAKVLYLNGSDHSPWRKLEDAAVAFKLEDRYSKAEILAAYLNTVYFGDGAYGVWAASERFFGLRPARLDLAQASLLAGLIQAPSAYDPFAFPAAARARQVEVLRAMVADSVLTQARATAVLARPLRLRGGTTLHAVHGVDLSPGPAFVWWEFSLGATAILASLAAFLALRLPGVRAANGIALKAALPLLAAAGFVVVVLAFRTA
jgi:penicillin-binding protein 1A